MTVRAKFRVNSIEDFGYSKCLNMQAVYEGTLGENEENKRFTKATPSGSIKMTIDNPYASEQFKAGDEWYVDFTPIAPAAAAPG